MKLLRKTKNLKCSEFDIARLLKSKKAMTESKAEAVVEAVELTPELAAGKTIFDKINMPYNTLRKKDNPIRPIVHYYKSKLKPGEELWWMDAENNSKPSSIVIKIWNNLSTKEKLS